MKIHPAAITVAATLSLLSISSSAQALNVNVKNAPYSAKGDGVTDDRAAIQRALNAVRDAGGGEVYVPNGNYRVTLAPRIFGETALRRVFTIYANVRVRGETRSNAIIKLANGQGNYGAIMAAQTLGANTSNFELSSITLDQNTTNNPVNSLTDIGTNSEDWSASPIRGEVWLSTGRNIKISNCRFSDNKKSPQQATGYFNSGGLCCMNGHGPASVVSFDL